MKIVENEFTKNKKIYALVILIIMISNLFSPYGVLANKVLAAPATGEPYYRLTLLKPSDNPDPDAEDIDDATYYYYYDYMNGMVDTPEEKQARAIVMELSIEGCNSVNSADIYFRWNTDKFVAGQTTKLTRKGTPYLEAATEYTNNSKYPDADFGITNWGSPVYEILDASAGTLRFTGGIATGSSYLTSGTVVGQFLFLLKDGVTIDDITTDDISLVTGAVGLEQGLQIAYFPDGKTAYHTDGKDYLLFSGFSAGAKQISSVELKTSPTKTQYYVGETLDFTDGELTVKYDDGSEENISIADAISSGKLTADSTVATNSKKVTLTYDSETVEFGYYVLDSITVSKNLNKMDYEHGDTIEFTGGELTATYKNSAGASTTRVLNIKDELTAGTLIVDKTTADVDNNVINFNYFGKTASINLTVTDPIASISITKQPNLLTYDDGETINLAGGQITPVTKSGKTLTPVATNASTVTSSTTTASIAQATNKWTIAGGDGLQAGNQKITLTYEGKTADITIVVNDTVSGVSITTQATAENKYGTPAGALNFDGLVATITTTGGGTFTVGASSLTIDTTTYNPNSVAKQSLPVRYGTISSTNNAEITLSNYITGISVNFTQTEFEYGTELGDVLVKGTYVENYADGTTSSPKAITSDMVTGYVASPTATLLTNHKYNETLTIKLSTSTNSFDQLPAVTTQAITLKDVPVSIDVASKPNKIFYNYGETFLTNGGQLKVNYKSGASQNISMGANTVSLTETDGSSINMSPSVSEFVNGKVTKAIKVNYTADGKTFDTSFDITIKDSVDSIAITTNPKLVFEHNDTFDASTGKLTVTYKSGNSEVVSLDEANITETDGTTVNMAPTASEYTNNQLTKTLKVEYAGLTTNYNITLKNTVASITVTAPTKVTYNLNDSTDLTGGKVTVTRKAGDTKDLALTDTKITVTDFDTSVAGTGKTANVKYTEEGKDYTSTFTYDVVNNITDIEIVAPSKTEYKHGENIATNGTITIKYADGTNSTRTMTESMITENDGSAVNMTPSSYDNSTNKLTKTLKITYTEDGITKTVNYTITIINTVKEVTLYGTPKTNYNVNEAMQPGLSILVTRETGTPEAIEVTSNMISNFNTTTEGTRTAIITYTENGVTKTVNYEYTVTDSVTSISIDTAVKEAQKYNEELDLTGATIKVISGKGTKVISLEQNMIKAGTYDKTTLGEQTVTVEYGGQQTTFKVNVKDYVIKIAVNPATVTGTYGDTLTNIINNNNVMYTVTYAKAGDKTAVAVAESMVTGYNPNILTAQNLTVTYIDSDTLSYTNGQGFTTTLTVTLQDEISNIEVTAPTVDQTYNYGGTLDLTGATITVNYVSGATPKTVTPTVNMVVEKGTTNAVNMSPLASEFTNNKLNKQVTLKYTEDGKEGSIDYLVTIVNDVKEVSMNVTPKTSYNIGESLDLTNGKITVKRATGTDEVINLTDSRVTVTGFDSSTENTSLTITVTFTENGITKQTSYEVSVIDTILSMEIETLPKQNYLYNEPLDVSAGTIKVTRNSGVEVINMNESMVKEMDNTPFNSKTLGTRNLKVTYGGITKTYEITVSDYVTGIIITPPTKTNYEYNEALDLTGGTVQKVMASGTIVAPVSLTQSMVSGYDATRIGAQTITVNYEGKQGNFGVIVSDNIQTIEMKTTPKTSYKYGETLDVTNGTIEVTRSSGAKEIIAITKNMVTGFNSETLGTQELIVNYNGKQTTYEIEVKDYVKGIEITKPTKLVYNFGETIDLTNGKVKEIMASGLATSPVAMTDSQVTITGFDTTTVGAKTITVKYKGFTKTFSITVVDPTSSMVIKTLPDKLDYKYGEELDLTGGTIQIIKTSGSTQILNITKQMISGYNPKKLGSQVITVTYDGKTAEFSVNVEDYVKQLNIKKPTKLEYEYGEELELDGGEVSVVMASGKISDKTALTASMVEGYNKKKEGKQTLKVTYKGLSGKFDVNVVDLVKAISMDKQPNKVKYNYGEELDVTGATIKVIKSSGIYKIPVTKDMTSGYSATTPGTQMITITYKDETTNFIVIVGEKPDEPVTPVKPEEPTEPDTPETPSTPVKPTRPTPIKEDTKKDQEEPNVDEIIETPNNTEEPTKGEDSQGPQQPQQEKPTATLGDKDEKENNTAETKMIAGATGLAGLLILLLLLVFKHNTKIYVQEDGNEYVLGGKERLSKNNKSIDVDKFLDGNTYPNKVKIVLDKKIAEKLDKQTIEIKHRGKVTKKVIKYNNEEFEIVLKELKLKE